ncbi:MAG: hypothetical protein D3908_01130 [Candidatus Electrothrix sp. AUS4]|nr:hypothetical protein [Candidatus Electrothrix sp. AUS4]
MVLLVELVCQLQFTPKSLVVPLLIIDKNMVDMGAGPENIRDPGQGQQGDLGVREVVADAAHRRGGHDGIADPVGTADKDVAGVFWNRGHVCLCCGIFFCSLRGTGYRVTGEDARLVCCSHAEGYD